MARQFGAGLAATGGAIALYATPLLAFVLLVAPARAPLPSAPLEVRARYVPLVVEIEDEVEPAEEEPAPAPDPGPPPASAVEVISVAAADAPPAPTAEAVPAATAGQGRGGLGVGRSLPGRRPTRRARDCAAPHPHVRVAGDGIVEIDRSLVDEYTASLDAFMRLGYSRPYDEEGVKGWYIAGFGCTSPVYKAGFRRADVLLSVNGRNTRSWVGVYLLYQRLKNREDFEVSVLRGGKPLTLQFRVVPG